MKHNVWVFIEQHNNHVLPVGLELISETKSLVSDETKITALYLGSHLFDEDYKHISQAGADEVVFLKHERLNIYSTQDYAKAITDYMVDKPDAFLIGSTLNGRDLAPRLSARLQTGLTADATMLEFDYDNNELSLLATRPALGGNLFATIACPKHKPQMATIRPNIFRVSQSYYEQSKLTVVTPTFDHYIQVEVIECIKLEEQHVDLNKAKVIVAGGRGVSTMFKELKELASEIGAEVAASRAVVDVKILPKERLVGQTGTTVKPKVYLAFGISGAIQHISGMDKSELIIAVNTDPKALIFDIADISIIADAKEVVPLLIKELEFYNT